MPNTQDRVAFGGGCFWCTEAVFLEIEGVTSVTPGYAGGTSSHPTYEDVSSGTTGHAEVILVEYNSSVVSFESLLGVFFAAHDPTQKDRQGADVGTQYRSIILSTTDEQKKAALHEISIIADAYTSAIATEVMLLEVFYPAEKYHVRYYQEHSNSAYSDAVITPKLDAVRARHGRLFKKD